MIADKIIEIAKGYTGQEEIEGNKGFKDPAFQKKMQDVGWKISDSWCCYFTELVWKEAYGKSHPLWKTLDKLFAPSCTATYSNFAGSQLFKVGQTPKLGSLMIFRYGSGWKGHVGIVTAFNKDACECIEGNTNDKGGREGYIVAKRNRKLGLPFKENGLNLVGFVYPSE